MALVVRVDGERVSCQREVQLQCGLCGRPQASQALSGVLTASLEGGRCHHRWAHKEGLARLRDLSKALCTIPRSQAWGGGAGWCGRKARALLAPPHHQGGPGGDAMTPLDPLYPYP